MVKYILAVIGVFILFVVVSETFVLDTVYDFYYKNNHYPFVELKPAEPKTRQLIDAVNEISLGGGGFGTGIIKDGKLEAACFSYESLYHVESSSFVYKFENCGLSDFFLRSTEIGPIVGAVKLELKAGEAKYYQVLTNRNARDRRVTWRLLPSLSPLETDRNSAAGTLTMPD